MNNELPRTKIDERTGIEYHLEGDYYIPNLVMPKQEKITLNKYGRMRLNYLKKHKKAEYSIMLLEGTLNIHLIEIQETATTRVEQIIKQLKEKSNLTEEMKNLREVKDDLLKEWIEFREETAFCQMTPQDKKYCIYFDEIAEKILKNVPEQNKKYVQKQLDELDKNFMNYLYYWNEKYYRNGFTDVIELLGI